MARRKFDDVIWRFCFFFDAVKENPDQVDPALRKKLVLQALGQAVFVFIIISILGLHSDWNRFSVIEFRREFLGRLEMYVLIFPITAILYLKLVERRWVKSQNKELIQK
ncbi:MAG: hypothetical protein ABJA67_13180 [Chthonomonadales bacterium]